MAALSLVELARTLIDRDSTTGREAELCAWLAEHLRGLGLHVVEQPLANGRSNLLATAESPQVVLSTHLDCVPPFFPSRIDEERLYGRGACDAKGALAAQVKAVERLREAGEHRVGLLFVVGEERGSDGATAADAIAAGSRFLVDGEPTESRLGLATRGVLRLKLLAKGRAAHSSQPELGLSAIDLLIDGLVELRGLELPADPQLGRTFYSVGLVAGGVAPNVISPSAEAELLFRTVGPGEQVIEALSPLRRRLTIERVLEVPPVRMHTIPGFDASAFAFTTDVPLLGRWGRPLLFGPGSVRFAHTEDEHVELAELAAAVDAYERIARELLRRPSLS